MKLLADIIDLVDILTNKQSERLYIWNRTLHKVHNMVMKDGDFEI